MKLTDLSLIFIGIILPVIIIVYVNVSFTIKAQEQQMYYQKVINIAVEDAANQMKEVENDDKSIDYGYSGLEDKKVSVNANIAKNTFFETMYNTLGIKGNDAAERYLQTFIPCLAIIDYNGVYISSQESYKTDGQDITEHVVRPKRYYTYSYYIDTSNNFKEGIPDAQNVKEIHTIEFSMDDYIIHRGCYKENNSFIIYETKGFYITDKKNNRDLLKSDNFNADWKSEKCALDSLSEHLSDIRKQVIIDTITEEIAFATNKANSYAKEIGVNYSFSFPVLTEEDMEYAIEDVGMFAFIQGLNIGNKYLNAKSYAISKLESSVKYYFSLYNNNVEDLTDKVKYINSLGMNYYHNTKNCALYIGQLTEGISPVYVLTKQQAASAQVTTPNEGETSSEYQIVHEGFYPCPICNP